MALIRGLRRLFQDGEETTNSQPTNTSPASDASLATTGWIFGLRRRDDARCLLDRGRENCYLSPSSLAGVSSTASRQTPSCLRTQCGTSARVAFWHSRGVNASGRGEEKNTTLGLHLCLKSALHKDFSVSLLDCFHFHHNQLSGWFTWSTFIDFVVYLHPAALLRKTSGRNRCSGGR